MGINLQGEEEIKVKRKEEIQVKITGSSQKSTYLSVSKTFRQRPQRQRLQSASRWWVKAFFFPVLPRGGNRERRGYRKTTPSPERKKLFKPEPTIRRGYSRPKEESSDDLALDIPVPLKDEEVPESKIKWGKQEFVLIGRRSNI